jgi:hypothetical protein
VGPTHRWVFYSWISSNLQPITIKTHTPLYRYGLAGVGVWVALENPRVTHTNPYTCSVAVAQAGHFRKKLDIKSSKINKILIIFEHIDLPKSRWVLYKH